MNSNLDHNLRKYCERNIAYRREGVYKGSEDHTHVCEARTVRWLATEKPTCGFVHKPQQTALVYGRTLDYDTGVCS